MKIYQMRYYDAYEGTILEWCSSKAEAERLLKDYIESRGEPSGPSGVRLCTIPASKSGMIEWLNWKVPYDR